MGYLLKCECCRRDGYGRVTIKLLPSGAKKKWILSPCCSRSLIQLSCEMKMFKYIAKSDNNKNSKNKNNDNNNSVRNRSPWDPSNKRRAVAAQTARSHCKLLFIQYVYYRAMHFSANARSCKGSHVVCLSVRPSVCPSVTLVICDHIFWKSRKSRKLIARTISPTPSLFVAKRRSIYSQGNMGKFGRD